METKKIDSDYIEHLLDKLINEYNLSENVLSNLLGLEVEKIKNYKKYEKELTIDLNTWGKWVNLALQLEYAIDVDSDSRFRGILNFLLSDVYEVNVEFIAKVAHVDEKYVVDFINGIDDLPIDIKYNIGATIMSLGFIFKNAGK